MTSRLVVNDDQLRTIIQAVEQITWDLFLILLQMRSCKLTIPHPVDKIVCELLSESRAQITSRFGALCFSTRVPSYSIIHRIADCEYRGHIKCIMEHCDWSRKPVWTASNWTWWSSQYCFCRVCAGAAIFPSDRWMDNGTCWQGFRCDPFGPRDQRDIYARRKLWEFGLRSRNVVRRLGRCVPMWISAGSSPLNSRHAHDSECTVLCTTDGDHLLCLAGEVYNISQQVPGRRREIR